ncbi:MAG: four helix bundle protein [Akkermansiaceae bacterium]|nr:four helix bundle protein [Akkermansiaceae bacterium]
MQEKPDIQKRSFDFACRVVRLCQTLEKDQVSRTVANQLLRPATSIGANVEEAQAAQSKPDFTARMYISCKEARETHYWLRILSSANIVPENKISKLKDESNQIVAILTTITKNSRADK